MKEPAMDGVPVTVTYQVLKLAGQPYYRRLDKPVAGAVPCRAVPCRAVPEQAYRANALSDAHHDDPEFGHRFLADEARDAGARMADRTAWRICRDNHRWSVSGKNRGRGGKAGPPLSSSMYSREKARMVEVQTMP
ncbi:hypothetical protein ACFWIB_42335, partial [Streptomyces sp. NPDC127051]